MHNRDLTLHVFDSVEDENRAELLRRARMTPAERCREFAAVQARFWGDDWTSKPIEKVIEIEIME